MSIRPLLVAATVSLGALVGPVHAEPVTLPVAALAIAELKTAYLSCDRAATESRLDPSSFQRCAAVGDELLQRGFDGDLDRLLAWWRVEQVRLARAEASAAPVR